MVETEGADYGRDRGADHGRDREAYCGGDRGQTMVDTEKHFE